MFKYEGGSFVNFRTNKAIDVIDSLDKEGQRLTLEPRNGQNRQLWKIVYLDKKEKEITKGLHPDFGLHCNRPFYFVSKLPMRRVAEMTNRANMVIKRFVKNRNGQQFKFDCISKTISNMHWKNYVLDIQSDGKSNNLRT